MKRIYDEPTWRAGQREFLKYYLREVRESNDFRDTGKAQQYLKDKRYPNGEVMDEETLHYWRGVAKGAEWKHIIFMPWRKSEEHGRFIVASKPVLDAEEESNLACMLGNLAFRTIKTLWEHDEIRGVYKWPRIIKVENYKGGGFPAYAWHARVVPK